MIQNKAKRTIAMLEERGFIQPFGYPIKDSWVLTVSGKIMTQITIKKLMSKSAVSGKQNILLDRMEEVNNNPDFVYKITAHKFHTEYLHDSEWVKHLFVIVLLQPKETDKNRLEELEDARRMQAKYEFPNRIEYLFYPKKEVINFLRYRLHNVIVRMEGNMKYKNGFPYPSL